MAGRKRRKLKLLAETVNSDKRTATEDNEKLELRTWSDLLPELLELIMSHLTLEDNVRASVVCKTWHKAAISVRVMNQSPLLMYFPRLGNLYEFYDPSKRTTYSLEFPELCLSRVCYSKDGWLLLYRPRSRRVFFFNPFTRQMIKLPRFNLTDQIVAFSCAPTSTNCMVLTINHISVAFVAISTCHPGATEWVTVNHQNHLPFISTIWNKFVFCNGVFYCMSLNGLLGVYDPQKHTWRVLAVPPPRCPENCSVNDWWKGKFMTQHNGDILVIYTCRSGSPFIFKLNQSEMVWNEMKTLDGVTIFASFLSSYSGTDLPGIMRNSVYFSKVRLFGKRCILYSFEDCRSYPRKQGYKWGERDPFVNIWIEPPQGA